MRRAERGQVIVVGGVHRRLELTLVGEQRIQLAFQRRRDVFHVVRLVGLEQQEGGRTMVGETEVGEEVRVARRDHTLAGEQSGVAMIGMKSVALPGVVPEHHGGTEFPDHAGHVAARRRGRCRVRHRPVRGTARRRSTDRTTGGRPRVVRPGAARPAPRCRPMRPTCPSTHRCTRGGARCTLPRPTSPAAPRNRTRRRRDGRRSPAPSRAERDRTSPPNRGRRVVVLDRLQPCRQYLADGWVGQVGRRVDVE